MKLTKGAKARLTQCWAPLRESMRALPPGLALGVLGVTWVLRSPALGSSQDTVPGVPISVEASTVGSFSEGYSWHLRVDSSGDARLSIDTRPSPTERRFKVSAKQLADLRAV